MAQLSTREIRMILKAQEAAEKREKAAEQKKLLAAYAEVAQPLFDRVQETVDLTDNPDSSWAGRSLRGIPFTVAGKEYTMSLTITDVERSAEKKAEQEAQALAILAAAQAATVEG